MAESFSKYVLAHLILDKGLLKREEFAISLRKQKKI